MSRRKQKQPQQLLNLTSGASRILENETPLAVKSHPSLYIPNSESSSALQRPQYSFVCDLFHKRHSQSAEKQTPVISPKIFKDSISSVFSSSFLRDVFFNSQMASPKLGLSATTTSSSSSPCASLCPPMHPGSPSRVPEGPPSPVTPAPSPGVSSTPTAPPRMQLSIALILEELRVLQQRQIHQMQITEEICRQVLRLGGASYNADTPSQNPLSTLPQLCLEADRRAESPAIPTSGSQPPASVAPLLACFSSLLPSQATNKPPKPSSSLSQILQPQKPTVDSCSGTVGAHGLTKGSPQSSTHSPSLASSTYPLALSLALPSRYLHEKSSNTTPLSGHSSLHSQNTLPSLSNAQHSQQSASEADTSSISTSSSRLQHICRFCSKSFSSDSALQIHLRSHTGERPFQCPVCFSRFTTRGNLKVHFLRHREQNPELSLSLLPPSLFGVALGSSGGSDIGQTLSSGHNQKTRKSRFDEIPDVSGASATFSGGVTEKSSPSSLPLPPSVDLALLSQSLLQLNRAAAAVASITASSSSASSSISSSSLFTNPPMLSPSALTGVFKSSKQQHFDENTPPHVPILSPGPYSQLVQHSKLLFPSVSSSPAASILSHPALGFLRTPLPSNSSLHQLTTSSHHPVPFTSSSTDKPSCPSTAAQCSLSSSVPTSTPTSETSKLQRLVEKLERVSSQTSSLWVSSSSSNTSSGLPSCCFTNASTSSTYVMASPTSSAVVNSSVSNLAHDVVAALGLSTNASGSLAGQLSAYNVMGLSSNLAANQCGVCLRVMSCPRALRLHQATHLGERPFPCKLCGRSFSTKGSLRSHLATHHARPANARVQNSCPLCQRKFTNALVLQHHIRMHLGGQLPPGIPDDPAACIAEESKALVDTDLTEGPTITSQNQTSSDADDTKSKDECKTDSSSPSLTTQSVSDGLSGHNTQTIPPGSVDQTCSTLLSEHQPTDQNPAGSDCVQQQTEAEFQVSASSSSPEPISNTNMFSKVENVENLINMEAEASTSTEILPCSESSIEKICDHLASLSPEITHSKETSLPTQQILSDLNSPELSKVEKEDFCKPGTTQSEHVNMPDKDPKIPSTLEAVDETKEDNSAQTSSFVKETQKHFHFGSYEREDRVEFSEAVDTSVPISLTPTLPSPLSRPEKKTYCCTECGKEYASRSGLKGHMKHHGVYSKTRLSARCCRSSSDQINSPVSSLNVPATRSSASFWNQYKTLLNTNAETHESPSGSQGESEPTRAVRSSARSRMESKCGIEAHKEDET